ncbi:16S rRNA (guanine(527)-N(7))-methyltransferase RsmG [Flaviflagellibacter deserti]|uniref:Ribosomal RNA small subunit methyltransferase G n=1 Tax=Flaviflagellibacter deserti TaxID=2267266 RepID=A0ABV9Z7P2_9HYPH
MSLEEIRGAFPNVSRETWDRLEIFVGLLLKWQKTVNLISPSTVPAIWTRHVADSLQLLQMAPAAKIWVDLGSGGGFPALVIAAALVDRLGARVHLIESDQRKCAFLREAVRHAVLPATIHNGRIEAVLGNWVEPAEVITARALAPLPRLVELAFPLLKTGAIGLFSKGRDAVAELTQTAKDWHIEAELAQSLTDPDGRIVVVSKAVPREDQR